MVLDHCNLFTGVIFVSSCVLPSYLWLICLVLAKPSPLFPFSIDSVNCFSEEGFRKAIVFLDFNRLENILCTAIRLGKIALIQRLCLIEEYSCKCIVASEHMSRPLDRDWVTHMSFIWGCLIQVKIRSSSRLHMVCSVLSTLPLLYIYICCMPKACHSPTHPTPGLPLQLHHSVCGHFLRLTQCLHLVPG